MSVIEKTRELGKAIQEDERYIRYMKACEINDTDSELQKAIGEFNLKRAELSKEMKEPDKNADKLTELDKEIREMYDKGKRPRQIAEELGYPLGTVAYHVHKIEKELGIA